MKVAFLCGMLNERGTSVANYDYAHFNEALLKNKSIILTSSGQDPSLVEKFGTRFQVFTYTDSNEIDDFIARESIDVCYMLVHGNREKSPERLPRGCKLVVHCVFNTRTQFGDVYAGISDYLNQRCGTACPVVPHMVHLPEVDSDLRGELGIPKDALVFGRHGGWDTFNIRFVYRVIEKVIRKRKDIYFLFLNTRPFSAEHKQIIHLPATHDMERKTAFVNTCDAMLHARKGGETFGIAVGEFSIKNKPVLTWKPPEGLAYIGYSIRNFLNPLIPGAQRLPKATATAHFDILQDKAMCYHNAGELYRILTRWDSGVVSKKNWDAYSKEYAPEPVMALFKKYFLD